MQEKIGNKVKYKEITTDSISTNPESQSSGMNITIKSDSLGFVTVIFGNSFSLRIDKKEASSLGIALSKGSDIAGKLIDLVSKQSYLFDKVTEDMPKTRTRALYPGHNPTAWQDPLDDPKDW